MDEFKIYSRLSYKYRLLYCLMLNYYRGYYADNKLKSKVLVLCTTKKELTESYDLLYSTIKEFKAEDIITLRKFITFYDKQLKQLFENIDDKGIKYGTIIKDIKQEYTPNKSVYKKYKYNGDSEKIPKDINVVFMQLNDADAISNRHLIRDIFIPQHISLNNDIDSNCNELCRVIRIYVKELMKTKSILKNNNATETDFLSLNIFLDSNDDVAIEDEVLNNLNCHFED